METYRISKNLVHKVQCLIEDDERIAAIKLVRKDIDSDLQESKELVDFIMSFYDADRGDGSLADSWEMFDFPMKLHSARWVWEKYTTDDLAAALIKVADIAVYLRENDTHPVLKPVGEKS